MLEEERVHLIDEACGVVAVSHHEDAARVATLALHALQHRGQEAAGLVSRDAERLMHIQRRAGLVCEQLTEAVLATLPGAHAIGHVRYSTSGGSSIRNAQPLLFHTRHGDIALAHNGNLTNAQTLRRALEAAGCLFATETDTEVLAHLIARSEAPDAQGAIIDAMRQVTGAFSLTGMTSTHVFAARDAHGVRPLVAGRLGEGWVMASETASFALIGARLARELEPGELLWIDAAGAAQWLKPLAPVAARPCIFELVYFARPDSTLFGRNVYEARRQMGQTLAREAPLEADVVIPVPDSGVPAAVGFARESGVPFELGLVRSHYIGRTFIEPSHAIRDLGVRLKLSPVREVLAGQRVVVVDDSIVRGTTCRKIVQMLRDAGAREVHFRVASPPTLSPCFYGIDTARREALIAHTHTQEAICAFIGADSLAYLSIEGLRRAVGASTDGPSFCEACFTRDYPVALVDPAMRDALR